MDYSAAIADDPAAASPWGSSSPRAQRVPFGGATPDSPRTPGGHGRDGSQSSLPGPALGNPQAQAQAHSNDGSFNEQEAQAPHTGDAQSHPAQAQQQQMPSQAQAQAQYSQAQHPQQQHPQQRSGAARYHNARQQRPVPQYKLQAKVTALERTGRKDPVLRFDIYVRTTRRPLLGHADLEHRPIYPDSEPRSFATSAEHTRSLSSYKSI